LCVFDLIAIADPASEDASAKKNSGGSLRLQSFRVGPCANSTPQRAHDFKSALRGFAVSLF
jgi:nitrate/nitrite-specific signal transduction histidine kinase